MEAFFPEILIAYLAGFRQVFSQPSYRLFCGYIAGLLITTGRLTTRSIAKTAFWIRRGNSTWDKFLSSAVWNPNQLIEPLVELVIDQLGNRLMIANHYVIAIDSTIVVKAAKKMIGVQRWKNTNQSQIGHHWMIGALLAAIGNRLIAFPIISRLICGKLSRCAFTVAKTGETQLTTFFDVALTVVISITTHLSKAPPVVVADAYFSKAPFITALMKRSIGLVTRLRSDRVGFWDKEQTQRTELRRWVSQFPRQTAEVVLYGRSQVIEYVTKDLFLRGIERPVRVLVITTANKPLILMSTAMSLTAEQIVEIYAGRFAIELAIRQMKSHLGFCEYQSTVTVGFLRRVQLTCCALTIGLVMMIESKWGFTENGNNFQFSFLDFRRSLRRYVIERLIGRKFASDADLGDKEPEMKSILRLVA